MNNIKRVNEISDNDTDTLITTNKIEVQELLTNTEFKAGQKILALYENGQYYRAQLIKFSIDKNVCLIIYDGHHDLVEINITKIKPIMNKICDNNLKFKKKCKVNYSVGDEVIIKTVNGTDNEAIIYEFLDDDLCILQFNDNEFGQASVRDIKPRESCNFKNYDKIIHETENNNILTGNNFDFKRDEDKSDLRNSGYKGNFDKLKDASTSVLNKSFAYNSDLKSLYVENDIIKAIHIDGNQCMDSILKLLDTDLGLIKFNYLSERCELKLNKITESFNEHSSAKDKTSIIAKVPTFPKSERIISIYKDGEKYGPIKTKNNKRCSIVENIPQCSTGRYCRSMDGLSLVDMTTERKSLLCVEPEIIIILSDGRSCPAKVIRFNSDVNTWVIKVFGFDVLQEINIQNLKPNSFYEQHQKKQLKQTSGTQDPNENRIASLHKSKEDYSNMDKDESIMRQVVQHADKNLQGNDSMTVYNHSADGFQSKDRYVNLLVKCEEENFSGTKLKVGDFVRAFYLDGQIYDAKVIKIFESNQTYQIKYLVLDVELNIPWRLVSPIKSTDLEFIHSFPIMTNENPAFTYWFLRGFCNCYYHYFGKLVRNQ